MTQNGLIHNILEQLFKFFNRKKIYSIVWYGNRKGKDIDIFVVSISNKIYERMIKGQLDVTLIEKYQLHHLINCLNPIVTEPILTGQVIWGNPLLYEKAMLNSINSGTLAVTHLLDSSFRIYREAQTALSKNNVNDALINLSFSISFYYFALHYKNHRKAITFKELLAEYQNSILSESYSALKRDALDLVEVNSLVEKAKDLFIREEGDFYPLLAK